MEDARQIDIQHALQIVRLVAHDQPVDGDAGVVHQHVKRPQFLHRLLDGPGAGFRIGDVELEHVDRRRAGPLALRLGFVRRRVISGVGDGDLRAAFREPHRHRAPDPPRCAGHERHLVLEVLGHGARHNRNEQCGWAGSV